MRSLGGPQDELVAFPDVHEAGITFYETRGEENDLVKHLVQWSKRDVRGQFVQEPEGGIVIRPMISIGDLHEDRPQGRVFGGLYICGHCSGSVQLVISIETIS